MIKFLARDDETGRIGTYQTNFVIPNLNKEVAHVPISSVVLSSQRVDLKDALFNAEKNKDRVKEEDVNPLVQNGQKLIPSVTRVFRQNQNMYVYLQAYEQGVPAVQPLVAFVSFYHEQTKAFETQPMEMTSGLNNRLQTMPFSFSIPLSQLPPGEYDCQISVLDPTGTEGCLLAGSGQGCSVNLRIVGCASKQNEVAESLWPGRPGCGSFCWWLQRALLWVGIRLAAAGQRRLLPRRSLIWEQLCR